MATARRLTVPEQYLVDDVLYRILADVSVSWEDERAEIWQPIVEGLVKPGISYKALLAAARRACG